MSIKLFIILALVCVASCRQSYYYANQDNNYHPPYDKATNANSLNINGTIYNNPDNCLSTFSCPAGFNVIPNPSYTITDVTGCTTPQEWINAGFPQAYLNQFNGCCAKYARCLQICGINKNFCDGQLFGCTGVSCDPSRNLRPGDRVYCRQLSSCFASYNARADSCGDFNLIQSRACTCSNLTASASPIGFNGKRQDISPTTTSTTTASPSVTGSSIPSASPSTFPSATSTNIAIPSASPSNFPSASSTPTYFGPNVNLYSENFGQYFVKPIPIYELYSNRCPPNFASYINVMTDQEQDDVTYFGTNQNGAGSRTSSWIDLL